MFDLEGCFDIHVHAGPDIFERTGDDFEVARRCADVGMVGMAVKGHIESTASRAYHINKAVKGFRYVGGICLNYPVGGINPAAVHACLAMGGRVVWMPSFDAQFHLQQHGLLAPPKMYHFGGAKGVTIFDDAGQLTPEIKEVVALVKEHNAVLATAHLSPKESMVLVDYCANERVKIIITHLMWTPDFDKALGQAAIEQGATVEICSNTIGGYSNRLTYEQAAALIQELGPRHLVLASDAGSPRLPLSHDALSVMANNLALAGVAKADLKLMMAENPLKLIER